MNSIYNGYSCETDSKNDNFKINNYEIKLKYVNGKQKWMIDSKMPLFDNVGTIRNHKKILVGEIDSSLYFISMMDEPKIVSMVDSYHLYKARKFLWIQSDVSRISDDILISNSGSYLVNIKSGVKYMLNIDKPPTETKVGKYKISDDKFIKWGSGGFKKIESSEEIYKEDNIEDVRKDELEEYLENNVTFEVVKKTDYMDEVDRTETPMPIAKIFYDMGDGNYPEDPDGEFEPPDQHEFAICAYYKFKELSDKKEAFSKEKKEAWIKRFKNSWSSLVRDVHFSFMSNKKQKEEEVFDSVDFDLERDIEEGVDLCVKHNGTEYQINLFVDSPKSREFLDKKKNYRHNENDSVEIEVPMKFRGIKKNISTNKEDLWLYNEEHFEAIKTIILEDKKEVVKNGNKICSVIDR